MDLKKNLVAKSEGEMEEEECKGKIVQHKTLVVDKITDKMKPSRRGRSDEWKKVSGSKGPLIPCVGTRQALIDKTSHKTSSLKGPILKFTQHCSFTSFT